MDEMDQYPHMKGHYLVMDNAPIHTSEDITKYFESRGYRCAYLPSYSPELNPIEQCWGYAKRIHRLCPPSSKKEDVEANSLAALDQVPLLSIRRWVY